MSEIAKSCVFAILIGILTTMTVRNSVKQRLTADNINNDLAYCVMVKENNKQILPKHLKKFF